MAATDISQITDLVLHMLLPKWLNSKVINYFVAIIKEYKSLKFWEILIYLQPACVIFFQLQWNIFMLICRKWLVSCCLAQISIKVKEQEPIIYELWNSNHEEDYFDIVYFHPYWNSDVIRNVQIKVNQEKQKKPLIQFQSINLKYRIKYNNCRWEIEILLRL